MRAFAIAKKVEAVVYSQLESAQTERSGDPATSEWSRGYQNAMDNMRRNLRLS